MWDKITDLLLAQGIYGVIILVQGGVIWWLVGWVRDLIKEKDDLQEKRVSEREDVVEAISKSTTAMTNVTKATEDTNRALDNIARSYPPRGMSA